MIPNREVWENTDIVLQGKGGESGSDLCAGQQVRRDLLNKPRLLT